MDWQNTARKQRGLSQKLYLIEATTNYDYTIMGSTGNVYNVKITNSPTCTCPDHMTRHNRCKHIYFVLLRIMKAANCDQPNYSNDEIQTFVNNISNIQTVSVDAKIQEKYHKLIEKNKTGDNANINDNNNDIVKGLDDLCPICLDDMDNGDDYIYCKADCGRAVHAVCFTMWTKKNKAACLYCKKTFIVNNKESDGEYINLL